MSDASGYWAGRYARGDTPWDKAMAAPPLTEAIPRGFFTGRILVPGSGPGHDARALAALPGVSVLGLDIVPQAVESARAAHAGAGLPLEFVHGDFFDLPATLAGAFDTLVEHTCLCAIDPGMRPRYPASAALALRPGGVFFGIFFLNPDTDAGPPFAISREEIAALFSPHFERISEWAPSSCFAGRENREHVMVWRRR